MDAFLSYLYGFLQADGNLYEQSRNRGKLSIEISKRDENIIFLLKENIKVNSFITYRNRTTNFGYGEFIKLSVYDKNFRDKIKSYGFPVGEKSDIIEPPISTSFEENDYIRGMIDGDGSLGLTGNGFPFISIITKSEKWKEFYIDYLFRKTGKRKNINRNKRDSAFNIMMNKEDAQTIIKELYYKDCICLDRKREKAKEVLSWIRPLNMNKR